MAAETELYYRLAAANNSFSPGTPINRATLFGGRPDQISRGIDAVYQRGTHAIIFGEPGVGKTSLAICLADLIPNPHEDPEVEPLFLTPRVNCTGSSTYESVWQEIFSKITFTQQVQQAGFSSKQNEEIKNFRHLLPEKINPGDVQHFLDLASRQKDIIVVIDEFDKLTNAEARNLMAHTIKALSDHAVPATLLLVGVGDTVDQLISEHQSIARCLRQIAMPRMNVDDIRDLVDKGINRFNRVCEDFKLSLADDAVTLIAELSRGMPHYGHLLAQQACCMAIESDQRDITKMLVLKGIGRAVSGVEQSVKSAYVKATTSSHKNALYREVLTASAITDTDALGFFAPGDVQSALARIVGRPIAMGTYMKHLNEFCTDSRSSVLEKTGEAWRTRFRFRDPLMPPYIVIRALSDRKPNVDFLLQNSAAI